MSRSRRVRRLLIAALSSACLAAAGARAWAADEGVAFLTGVEDVPLPPGLVEDRTAGIAFDTAEGRIVQALATGEIAERDVRDFYAATLPELGWVMVEPFLYRRGGEQLRLDVAPDNGRLAVRFSLSPQ